MKAFISSKNNINVVEVLEQLRDDVKNLPEDLKSFSYKIFTSKEIQDFIIERNINLLKQGLRPDLTPITKVPVGDQSYEGYERYTIYNRSEGLNGYNPSQTQFVDLYKTGFFYESLKVRSGSKELLEFSEDPKSLELEAIWGNILGISSEDVNDLILILRSKIIKFVKVKLKVKL